MRKTKIVCTIGPATDSYEMVKKLVTHGMNVARLNFSHSEYEHHKRRLMLVKQIREELSVPVAILLDTKGPEIRIKEFSVKEIELKDEDLFTLTTRDIIGDEKIVSVTYKNLTKDIIVGNKILIDDGLVELVVLEINGEDIVCRVTNGGKLSNNKGVNIPSVHIQLPYISEKDKNDILFAIENDFDFIAASFVRNKEDVLAIKSILDKNNGSSIKVIAKIESRDGVENIDSILEVSDGIMVARGDMGVELPFEELPRIQKMLIKKCVDLGKPVITATQMLESMIKNYRPTRAETTDIANAIYDGTTAIMLSGETAIGKYPIEAVKAMAKIARYTDKSIDYKTEIERTRHNIETDVSESICHATCLMANDLNAKAIISITLSGYTAKMISKFKPACQIIAATVSKKSYYQLALSWGVVPVMCEIQNTTDALFSQAINEAIKTGLVKLSDLVIISGGIPLGVSGNTNIIKVQTIGECIFRSL